MITGFFFVSSIWLRSESLSLSMYLWGRCHVDESQFVHTFFADADWSGVLRHLIHSSIEMRDEDEWEQRMTLSYSCVRSLPLSVNSLRVRTCWLVWNPRILHRDMHLAGFEVRLVTLSGRRFLCFAVFCCVYKRRYLRPFCLALLHYPYSWSGWKLRNCGAYGRVELLKMINISAQWRL